MTDLENIQAILGLIDIVNVRLSVLSERVTNLSERIDVMNERIDVLRRDSEPKDENPFSGPRWTE